MVWDVYPETITTPPGRLFEPVLIGKVKRHEKAVESMISTLSAPIMEVEREDPPKQSPGDMATWLTFPGS